LNLPIEYGPFYIFLKARLASPLHSWRVKEVCTLLYCLGVLQCYPGEAAMRNTLRKLESLQHEVPTLYFVNAMCGVALMNHK
jgi:hypothetical protein